MAPHLRRLVLAATLGVAVALLLCTTGAPVARAVETSAYTAAQRENTLKVLQALASAISPLESDWKGEDFCRWPFVYCAAKDLSVKNIPSTYTGTLPEMPEDVDYEKVLLKELYLSSTREKLSGTLPKSWGKMRKVTLLSLHSSKVEGSLPTAWSSLTALTHLYLHGTKLRGALPADWSSLTSLQDLRLFDTNVEGSLPTAWSSLTALTQLYLHKTQISGALPADWSALTALRQLHLSGTQVEGPLPTQWSAMESAEELELDNCDLSGSLPSSWSEMPKLKSLSLTGNNFCGCVPDSWAEKPDLVVTIEDKHVGSECSIGDSCRIAVPPSASSAADCEVDNCDVCEGDSAARCARCSGDYLLTEDHTCLGYCDDGAAAVWSGVAAAAVVCAVGLLSVGVVV